MRPAGWHAYNIARIEAGTPLYNIDFGEQSLPGETGVLRDRVHFKKGCYLGQEVVARMDALGKPKQVLVALRFAGNERGEVVQPFPGAHVMVMTEESAQTVGAVTSSTISPMLGGEAVAFAQVKTKFAEDLSVALEVAAEGSRVRATVQPSLLFWVRDS
jgi:folate-binding protein YgfZ